MSDETPAPLCVVALNGGSTSLKFGVFRVHHDRIELLLGGSIAAIVDGVAEALTWDAAGVARSSVPIRIAAHADAVEWIASTMASTLPRAALQALAGVGHRIVHGGPELLQHCLIDAEVMGKLQQAIVFAPVHGASELAVVARARVCFPELAQIACFDTAFHADLPPVARELPIPAALRNQGIHRYGFHGLACESVIQQLALPLPGRLVIAHLGGGCSVTAVRDGHSIDTSMGLTPAGGVLMGTRSGDLDPGVLIHLLNAQRMDVAALAHVLNFESGMLGLSGISADIRHLRAIGAGNADARLAIAAFCYSVRKQIAAMIAALGGIDLLVFSGGIGEHDAQTRTEICAGLEWCGVRLDAELNGASAPDIAAPASRCAVRVVHAQEEQRMARHVYALVRGRSGRGQSTDA